MKQGQKILIGAAVVGGLIIAANSSKGYSKLTNNQKEYVALLHPAVRASFISFILEVQKRTGLIVKITSAYRSWAKQASLYAENSKNARPGHSHHNYGLAIDINLLDPKTGNVILRKASTTYAWEKTGIVKIAKKYGLNWGGYFKSYHDPIHFYFAYDTSKLKERAIDTFCGGRNTSSCPSKVFGNKVKLVA